MSDEQKEMWKNIPERLSEAKSTKKKFAIIGVVLLGIVCIIIKKKFL